MRRALVLSALLGSAALAPGLACAEQVTPEATEAPARERIDAQRAVLRALLSEQEADCEQEFAIADCIDDARAEQRDELARLKVEDLNYEAAQRVAQALRRRQALNDKAAAFALRVRVSDAFDAAARAAEAAQAAQARSASAGATLPPRRTDTPASRQAKAPVIQSRAALEAQHEADFKARLRSAEAHRQAVNDRNATRAAEGMQMAPLPDVAAVAAVTVTAPAPRR